MRRRLSTVSRTASLAVAVVGCAAAVTGCAADAPKVDPTYPFRGRVVNAATGRPIGGARVTVEINAEAAPDPGRAATTATDGTFTALVPNTATAPAGAAPPPPPSMAFVSVAPTDATRGVSMAVTMSGKLSPDGTVDLGTVAVPQR